MHGRIYAIKTNAARAAQHARHFWHERSPRNSKIVYMKVKLESWAWIQMARAWRRITYTYVRVGPSGMHFVIYLIGLSGSSACRLGACVSAWDEWRAAPAKLDPTSAGLKGAL